MPPALLISSLITRAIRMGENTLPVFLIILPLTVINGPIRPFINTPPVFHPALKRSNVSVPSYRPSPPMGQSVQAISLIITSNIPVQDLARFLMDFSERGHCPYHCYYRCYYRKNHSQLSDALSVYIASPDCGTNRSKHFPVLNRHFLDRSVNRHNDSTMRRPQPTDHRARTRFLVAPSPDL